MKTSVFVLATFVVVGILSSAYATKHVDVEGVGRYLATPVGYIREECVREVPNGAHIEEFDTHMMVTHADGTKTRMEHCDTSGGTRPVFLEQLVGLQGLPADYDGWEEYTAVKTNSSYNAFLGYFSVPDKPQNDPQVLYLFTGLQNINWIPKVTPLPSVEFDIIQPVLQYPNSDLTGWSVKSWWVTLKSGAMFSTELNVEVGDNIFGNMTRTGAQKYYIGSTIASTGQTTGFSYSNARLVTQPWGYNTLECYGCQNCATYPTNNCEFTKLQLFTDGEPVKVDWKANPFPSQDRKCNEEVDIIDPATVTVIFNSNNQ